MAEYYIMLVDNNPHTTSKVEDGGGFIYPPRWAWGGGDGTVMDQNKFRFEKIRKDTVTMLIFT